jgi:hypothetical protein
MFPQRPVSQGSPGWCYWETGDPLGGLVKSPQVIGGMALKGRVGPCPIVCLCFLVYNVRGCFVTLPYHDMVPLPGPKQSWAGPSQTMRQMKLLSLYTNCLRYFVFSNGKQMSTEVLLLSLCCI